MTTDLWGYREPGWGSAETPLKGFGVEATDGSIGKIDEATYEVGSSYVVVETGPWIFGKRVILPAGVIDRVDYGDEKVWVAVSKDQIKNAPAFNESSYRNQDEYRRTLGEYYRPYYDRGVTRRVT